MAFRIHGNMLVSTVKEGFKEEFELSMRIYDGSSFADDSATLASIRPDGYTGGEISAAGNMQIGTLENKIRDAFGIKINISDINDKYLKDNGLTLAGAR